MEHKTEIRTGSTTGLDVSDRFIAVNGASAWAADYAPETMVVDIAALLSVLVFSLAALTMQSGERAEVTAGEGLSRPLVETTQRSMMG